MADAFLSKYGLFTKKFPWSKEFFVLKAAATMYGELSTLLGADRDGVQRLHTTLTSALSACVAARGDVIHVLPGHTETFTAALTISKSTVTIIGYGGATLRPIITVNAVADGFNVTGADVTIENIGFAAPATDEATAMINVAAAGVTLRNIYGIGSTTVKNFVDCITIASGANDLTIEGLRLYNSVVAVNSFISIEAAVARLVLRDIFCFGDVVAGGLIDGAAATQIFMENVRIAVVGTTKPAATLDSNPTGMARNCFFSGTDTTLANNGALGNALRMDNIKVLEETDGSKSGAIIPAADTD